MGSWNTWKEFLTVSWPGDAPQTVDQHDAHLRKRQAQRREHLRAFAAKVHLRNTLQDEIAGVLEELNVINTRIAETIRRPDDRDSERRFTVKQRLEDRLQKLRGELQPIASQIEADRIALVDLLDEIDRLRRERSLAEAREHAQTQR